MFYWKNEVSKGASSKKNEMDTQPEFVVNESIPRSTTPLQEEMEDALSGL